MPDRLNSLLLLLLLNLFSGVALGNDAQSCTGTFDLNLLDPGQGGKKPNIVIVTGHQEKWSHFSHYARASGFEVRQEEKDSDEIVSDADSVVVEKASQFPSSEREIWIVEDSALNVERTDKFGILVKYHIGLLPQCEGRRATWETRLAYRMGDKVYVFTSSISGTIVARTTQGGGFPPFFLPDGQSLTLAQSKFEVNPRADVFNDLIEGKPTGIFPAIDHWNGDWQEASPADLELEL